jgi:catechol 2,3-dioxygenase-like lactoylglutathione lyase family enzyme
MRAHVSINVTDVPKSVTFYQKIFGVEPQKQTGSYAKFDLKSPSLNFSMQSGKAELSRVSHFGVEVESMDEVGQWEKRLIESGVLKLKESETNCCYAKQSKLWFTDPDGNAWEVFYVHEQLPVTEETRKASACCG